MEEAILLSLLHHSHRAVFCHKVDELESAREEKEAVCGVGTVRGLSYHQLDEMTKTAC